MGKYNVGYHGPERRSDNLEGIATLTHDPIAMDNIWKDVADIEEVKQKITDITGIPKEAFEEGEE